MAKRVIRRETIPPGKVTRFSGSNGAAGSRHSAGCEKRLKGTRGFRKGGVPEYFGSFPHLNPHPVLDIDSSGDVVYSNPAATAVLKGLGLTRKNIAVFVPKDMESIMKGSRRKKNRSIYREATVKDKIFSLHVVFHPGFNVARIYAYDITGIRRADDKVLMQMRILAGINAIFEGTVSAGSFEKLGQTCLFVVQELTGSGFGFIGRIDLDGYLHDIAISDSGSKQRGVYVKKGHLGAPGDVIRGLYGKLITDGKPLFTNEPSSYPDSMGLPAGHPPLTAFLGCPLIHDGKCIGVICLGNRDGGYRQEDLNTVELLAPAITEALVRKKAEDALVRSEELYRSVVENQSEFVDRYLPGGILTYVNDALARYLGMRPQDLIGKSFYPFLHEDDREELIGKLKSLTKDNPLITVENRLHMPEGSVCWHQWTHQAFFDQEGAILEYQSVGRDITQRKRAEEALRESEKKYRFMIESTGTGFVILDSLGHVLEANAAYARLTGYDAVTEILGRSVLEWTAGYDREWQTEEIRNCIDKGYIRNLEIDFVDKIGRVTPVEMSATTIRTAEGNVIFSLCRDISERKKVQMKILRYSEELEKQVQERTAKLLVANRELKESRENLRNLYARQQELIEHERRSIAREIHDELGQLLTAVNMDLAWMSSKYEDHIQLAEKIRSLTELLDTALETVQGLCSRLRPGVLDILGLVPAMKWQAREFTKRSGIVCRMDMPRMRTSVNSDVSTAIFRIFQEALTNVMRHSEATEVDVRMRTFKDAAIVLTIKDNGRGMTQEQMYDIRSLGLMGMKERIELLGGEITFRGVSGKGTTVAARFPFGKEGDGRA